MPLKFHLLLSYSIGEDAIKTPPPSKKKKSRVNSERGMSAFNLRATFVSVCTRPPAEEAYLCSPVIYRSLLSVCSWPLSYMQPYKCSKVRSLQSEEQSLGRLFPCLLSTELLCTAPCNDLQYPRRLILADFNSLKPATCFTRH